MLRWKLPALSPAEREAFKVSYLHRQIGRRAGAMDVAGHGGALFDLEELLKRIFCCQGKRMGVIFYLMLEMSVVLKSITFLGVSCKFGGKRDPQ